ncbi:hypothetical protein EAH75_01275 [Rhodanobacter glycinis]|uniref:hypothetical protein n=1 Tax=Rhodanobacter glycinis TaxID=582702 RepID=UPI00112A195D|nr:hypothetical protein [Rhodanobacter glycinis]TPG50157.1 hypothetical protein EAH75_01275 [Rhodanobacter glycinis]
MNLARAQLNYDNRLPPDDSMREAAIESRTEQLTADYWQDLEYLSDALSDVAITVGWYRNRKPVHHGAVRLLTLLRDGSDDLELAQIIREAALQYIAATAGDEAEHESLERGDL